MYVIVLCNFPGSMVNWKAYPCYGHLRDYTYCFRQLFQGLHLFRGLCLLFSPTFPVPMLIQGPTLIRNCRVICKSLCSAFPKKGRKEKKITKYVLKYSIVKFDYILCFKLLKVTKNCHLWSGEIKSSKTNNKTKIFH